jgi:DNA invertase Pin-like site-specific DNA recombinase
MREFSDTASGAKFSREGLDALMREVRKGRIDIVVAYKLDRLGRSLARQPP